MVNNLFYIYFCDIFYYKLLLSKEKYDQCSVKFIF